ncbi:MAG TPA: hypothetical protein VE778_05780 [Candidatus Bathyarchaeia archaeon]|jgi:hypothetical protein|nr:hypothetical protein [Candidatus Bathyarchaeia archaeon]
MRFARTYVLAFLSLLLAFPVFGQQATSTVQRDLQAVAVLQASVRAMGGSIPSDSTATGTVTLTAGTSTQSGNISILTRGTEQTSEQIQTSQVSTTTVYSNLQANAINDSASTPLSAELAATSRSVVFPLLSMASTLNNADSCLSYVGIESVNGASAHHIRYWNSFNSHANLQFLAEFTLADIWIDAASYLPQRISQIRRGGRGLEPRITLDTVFANYQKIGGAAYPLLIQRSLNGSPWMTITITNVSFNTGLTDSSFPVQ